MSRILGRSPFLPGRMSPTGLRETPPVCALPEALGRGFVGGLFCDGVSHPALRATAIVGGIRECRGNDYPRLRICQRAAGISTAQPPAFILEQRYPMPLYIFLDEMNAFEVPSDERVLQLPMEPAGPTSVRPG